MQDIQTKAMQTYQENLNFFKKNFPSVYHKILALDTLLSEGSYPQKYELEYKDGYFDVIDIRNNEALYKGNSNEIAEQQVDEISLKKDDQVFESYRKIFFEKESVEFLKKQNSFGQFTTIAPIIDYYNRHIDTTTEMTQLNKFIFLGSGLGLHITKAIEKYDIQVPFIVESDIELFRLSLFVTNYKELAENRDIFFAIALNDTEFYTIFNLFFSKAFMKNLYLKFYLFSQSNADKMKLIQSELVVRPEIAYSHDRLLVKNIKVMYKLKEKFPFLNLLKKPEENFFDERPVLILGAGPSLHKNIEWLQANQDKFVIMASLVTLKTLKKADITPDIIVQVDENEHTTKKIVDNLGDADFVKNAISIFSASVPEIMFDRFQETKIYLHEDRTKYKLSKSTMPVASVGETLYVIPLVFNVKSIYMLGIDLALGEDGSSHSPEHVMAKKVGKVEVEEFSVSSENTLLQVKGNFRETVDTNPLLAMSIPVINYKTDSYKSQNQTIYNLSDGAYFNHTLPTHIEDIEGLKTINKSNLSQELVTFFDRYSSSSLDDEEMEAIECRVKHIAESRAFLQEFQESPHTDKDIFEVHFIQFISKISNSKCKFELWEILITYTHRITPYIDDFFNTKEMKVTKKHIKKLRTLIISQFEKIINDYEEIIEELIKEEI